MRAPSGRWSNSTLRRVLGGSTFQEVVSDKREDLMKHIAATSQQRGRGLRPPGRRRAHQARRSARGRTPRASSTACAPSASARPPSSAAQGAGESNRIQATPIARRRSSRPRPPARSERRAATATPSATRSSPMPSTRDPDFFEFYRSMQAYDAACKSSDTRAADHARFGFLPYFARPERPRGQAGTLHAAPPAQQ